MRTLKLSIAISFILNFNTVLSNAQPFTYPRCSDYVPPSFPAPLDTFYVNINDSLASDTLDGSSPYYISGLQGPWKTIQKAALTMTAGDITFVIGGTYNETNITFSNSGTPDAPIILSAYGSPGSFDTVIIDGSFDPTYPYGIYLEDTTSNIVIQGVTIQNMKYGLYVDYVVSNHHKNIVIREVTVRNNGFVGLPFTGVGLLLGATDGFVLESITAYENVGDGISISGSDGPVDTLYSQNGYIVNSVSYDNDDGEPIFQTNSHGIAINQGRNIAICNSEAYGNTDHGFDVSDWPKGDPLSYNISLENNISYKNYYAAGFAVNSDAHHILYLRNLSYENYIGFYGYSGIGRVEYYHNVALRNRNQGFVIDTNYNVFGDPGDSILIFKNNITYNNDTIEYNYAALQIDTFNLEYQVTATHNNLQVSQPTTTAAHIGSTIYTPSNIGALGPGNVSKDPGFVDGDSSPPNDSLDPTSEMIDAGTVITINGVPEPYYGRAPDIGRHEYCPPNINEYSLELESKVNIYPNPFRQLPTIGYQIPVTSEVSLKIYDITGRTVKTLVNTKQEAGNYNVNFDAKELVTGIYFVRLIAGDYKATKKLILVR